MIVIGDTHGLGEVFKIIDKEKIEGKNLIHVGDFGLGFQEISRDIKNLLLMDEMLLETNNKLYVVRGNHDCPIFWDKSKGLNLPKFQNLFLVEDYSVYTIEDKQVLFVGGGISIDRTIRKDDKPYATWWKDEEFELNISKLNKAVRYVNNIDIVVTHTAPMLAYPKNFNNQIVKDWTGVEKIHGNDLIKDLANERYSMNDIYVELIQTFKHTPKYWFYGHFHPKNIVKEKIDNTEFICLPINKTIEI